MRPPAPRAGTIWLTGVTATTPGSVPVRMAASRVDGVLLATRRHRAPEPWAERVERDGHGTTEEAPVASGEIGRARCC